MSFDALGEGALDYSPCRYGNSRLLFRGPPRSLEGDYLAFLGGSETYGRFLRDPFPALVEAGLGVPCVNLGCMNAGIDMYLNDPGGLAVAAGARVVLLQVPGAQNLSNRLYTVHGRRNDRFLQASPILRSIFPEVDFTDIHFTRHLLQALYQTSRERFSIVQDELTTAWLSRMKVLIARIGAPVLLVWFARNAPGLPVEQSLADTTDPVFVTRDMIAALSDHVVGSLELVPSGAACARGTAGMVFGQLEAPAARALLGPKAHEEAATSILGALRTLTGRVEGWSAPPRRARQNR